MSLANKKNYFIIIVLSRGELTASLKPSAIAIYRFFFKFDLNKLLAVRRYDCKLKIIARFKRDRKLSRVSYLMTSLASYLS